MQPEERSGPRTAREAQETFAKANERIRASAEHYDFDDSVPFLCECSEVTCVQSVRLSLTNYREARRGRPQKFIMLPGHHDPRIERIAVHREAYVLVESLA